MAGSLQALKRREWQQRMERFEAAGQSVVEFCRDEGISIPSFYQWRKRLGRQSHAAASEAAGFQPVRLITAASIAVALPGGTRLEVPTADRRVLRLVLERVTRADARRADGGDRC